MDESELVKIIDRAAKSDSVDGQGRIILSDFRIDIGNPDLKAEEIIIAWRKFYPYHPIRLASQNVIIISFDPRPPARDRYVQEHNQK